MRIKVRTYILTIKHDGGILDIATAASSKEAAASMVMAFEHCPRRAIKKIRWAK
jgi:ferredoxin